MAKKNFDEYTVRRNVQLEAELETERAAVAARDAVIAELMEKAKAAPAAAAPVAAPPPAPTLKQQLNALPKETPDRANFLFGLKPEQWNELLAEVDGVQK